MRYVHASARARAVILAIMLSHFTRLIRARHNPRA